MTEKQKQKKPEKQKKTNGKNLIIWILIVLGLTYMIQWGSQVFEEPPKTLTYNTFFALLKENRETGYIVSAVMMEDRIIGKFNDGSKYVLNVPAEDPDLLRTLRENVEDFDVKPAGTFLSNIFWAIIGPIVLVTLFWFLMYRGAAAGGGAGKGAS